MRLRDGDVRSSRHRFAVAADALGLRVLTPASAKDPASTTALRELAPDACPVVAYGALLPRAALDIPAARLGQPALLAAARLARCGAGAARGDGRGRRHRGVDVPHRGGPRHRSGVRDDDRDGTAHGHGGRPARPARGRAAPGSSWPRWTASRTAPWSRNRNRRKVFRSRRSSRSTTPGSTGPGPAFVVDRLVRGCTPNPGAWTTFRGERVKVEPVTPADDPTSGRCRGPWW